MISNKSDRRVRYTKMVLKNALIDLMEEKPISKITIKEICEKADINRGTFYAHYTDQFDLQNQIFEDILIRINEYMDAAPYIPGSPEARAMLTGVFRYASENRRIIKVLISENSTIHLQDEVLQFLVTRRVFEGYPVQPAMAEYLYNYIAFGCVGLVRKWLTDGTESPEQFADLVMQLTGTGLVSFR